MNPIGAMVKRFDDSVPQASELLIVLFVALFMGGGQLAGNLAVRKF